MQNRHFSAWKSNEVYPTWATPDCVFGFPQSNDSQKIKTYRNQPLSHLYYFNDEALGNEATYETSQNSYPRLIPETKGCRLRPLEAFGFNIKYLIFIN